MSGANELNNARSQSLAQSIRALLVHYLGNRRVLAIVAFAAISAGLALNWSWLVAAGIAPILLALAPCAAMCALGLCMSKMGGRSCTAGKDGAAPAKHDATRGAQ